MKLSIIIPGFGWQKAQATAMAERIRAGVPEAEVIVADGVNVAAARNAGLDRCRGEFVAWVDADDELADGWFELMRKLAAEGMDTDLLVFDYFLQTEEREVTIAVSEEITTPEDLLGALLRDDVGSYLWHKVTRAALWKDCRFDERLEVLEDYMLFPRVLDRAKSLKVERRPLYRYRRHNESILHRSPSDESRERVVRIALSRVEEWSRSRHAVDALIGAAVSSQQYLEKYLLEDRPFPRFADEVRGLFRANFFRLIFARRCSLRNRVKFAASAWGWWWVQRLAWRLHKVK